MRNERGYVFFSTLIVLSIVLIIIVDSVNLFVTEKRFADKTESVYIIDHLLFLAKIDAANILQEEESEDAGMFLYENGNVVYTVDLVDENLVKVSFIAFGNEGGKGQAYFLYDLSESKITKWSEV